MPPGQCGLHDNVDRWVHGHGNSLHQRAQMPMYTIVTNSVLYLLLID
jgi:hypothetical protein